ncbi:Aste57867_924 [Aphanomyces stellatus]|uniref:Aste57867_924 protein n=1 Tax=Aphanomyces stellatus TaxID=120398 RepID=A0A485K477_9STRA|nr:hypothetical protein As57867_000923 [Aphanomyces stellatus]VFT78148.1 Aste57867_924 [Aphanomyces stellatus]
MYHVPLLSAVFAGLAAVAATDYRVPVQIIFRAYCPACQWFISDPVYSLMQDDGFRAITNLQYVPAAAMRDIDGVLDCTGGASECEGHRWMACVLDRFKDSPKATSTHMAVRPCMIFAFVIWTQCIEGEESGYVWMDKVAFCFKDLADFNALAKCKDEQGDTLVRKLMTVAAKLEGPWQPYTIVDGTVLGSASAAVTLDMMQIDICKRYKGPSSALPPFCDSVPGVVRQTEAPAPVAPVVPVVQDKKVKVQVIWRAYCPACKWYLSDPVYNLLVDPEFQAIIDFEPYPSGSTVESSPGQFQCGGGASECTGHLYMSCALRLFPSLSDVAANLKCLEDSHQMWDKRVKSCFSGKALEQVKACFASDTSKQYLREYIAVSSTIHQAWVPYTIIDGTVIGTAREGVHYEALTKAICDAYTGLHRPSVCGPAPGGAAVVVQAEPVKQPVEPVKEVAKPVQTAAPVVAKVTEKKAEKKAPVMPCRQKEKGFEYDDPPDIGKPATDKAALNGGGGVKLGAVGAVGAKTAEPSSFLTNPLLLPMLLIGGLLFAALRYSKPEKKKM